MKLRYILTSLLACLAFAVGCVQEELPGLSDIEVAPSYFTFGVDGGSKDVTVNTSSDWTVGDIPEWLTVNPASGNGEGKFTVTATASTDTLTRTAYLKVKAGEEVQLVTVNQDAFVPAFPAFKGGEYWIMTRDKASVVFPIDDGGQGYGYMNVVKAVDGKSTADNIYTFAAVEGETDGFTIVDTKGQYHIGSTYNSFTVSTTNPKDGSEVWYVKQISADEFDITNKTNGKSIFMSTYGNFCPYSKGDAKVVTENPYPCLVSASGEDAVEIKFAVEPKEVALKKEAGEFTIDMTCRNEGFEIKPSASWIVLKGMTSTDGEYEVTFSYAENTAGARTATIDFISGEEKFVVEVSQEGSIVDATVAEFLAAEIGPALFKLTGKVANLQAGDYGNFDLVDATGSVYVYGLTAKQVEKNDKSFPSLGIKEGDVVTLIGTRADHNGTAQVGGPAYYVSHIGHTEVTIAEFLTKEKSADNWYKLTGTIEEIVKEEYGNFYLKDDTGRVFVYGLTVAPVAKNDKSFAKLGLKVGDKVTLIGTKDYYEKSSVEDQKHQVGGPAYYISHETPAEGGDDTGNEGGNDEGDSATGTYTYTFAKDDLGANGTPSSEVTLNGVKWNFSMTDSGSKYLGWDSNETAKGVQIGKGADPATEVVLSTEGVKGTVKSIKVNTSGASDTDAVLDVTVGGAAFGTQATLTKTATDYTFTGSASGKIVLKWTCTKKAIYVKSIEIVAE